MKNTELPNVSLRALAAITGVDRDTIKSAINRAALKPTGNPGGHPVYPLADVLRALFARKGDVDPLQLTPADRRALADAKLKEHALAVKAGEYLPRESVRTANATAFQMVAQSIRAIPDALERRLGLSGELADAVGLTIDDVLADLADRMEAVHAEQTTIAAG